MTAMRLRLSTLAVFLLAEGSSQPWAEPGREPAQVVEIGAFSREQPSDDLPRGWELFRPSDRFPPTRYRLERSGSTTVVRAEAKGSMAGLIRRLRIDPARTPYLCWRWRIAAPLQAADLRTKTGDDYAARLYVLFDYDAGRLSVGDRLQLAVARGLYGPDVPAAALNYVWDNRHPIGTVAPNAYTDRTRMWVLRSGAHEAGRWVTEMRNVAADFRAAFREDAPVITGIIIASDTDNTGEKATAWFGEIRIAARAALCEG